MGAPAYFLHLQPKPAHGTCPPGRPLQRGKLSPAWHRAAVYL
jgi:hypothetical protein